jgi:hypothetical protein
MGTLEMKYRALALPDEEAAANARLAHLTGICPKCGDEGWWIDNSGFHYCACAAGAREQEEAGRRRRGRRLK